LKLPPIRYPLPTLILLAAVVLLAWRGEALTRPLRSALASRWERVVSGPPVPSSTEPKVVAGPILRRVLLLSVPVNAWDRPGGTTVVEVIRHRQFADVYDVWPLKKGPVTHYRIGNRRPVGWVRAEEVLPWDTRLVIRAPGGSLTLADPGLVTEVGKIPLPVLGWDEKRLQVAVWRGGSPFGLLAWTGWFRSREVPPEAWAVLLSQLEVQRLVERFPSDSSEPPEMTRLRAVLGRLSDPRPLSRNDLEAARAYLPSPVFEVKPSPTRAEDLLQIFEHWTPDAAWSGFTFKAIPLSALP
jgi:hypothetical protein